MQHVQGIRGVLQGLCPRRAAKGAVPLPPQPRIELSDGEARMLRRAHAQYNSVERVSVPAGADCLHLYDKNTTSPSSSSSSAVRD